MSEEEKEKERERERDERREKRTIDAGIILHGTTPRKEIPVIGTELHPRRSAGVVVPRVAGGEHGVVIGAYVDFGVVAVFLALIHFVRIALHQGYVITSGSITMHEEEMGRCD